LKIEFRKRSFWRGTVRKGEPVLNLYAILREILADPYWDYDMEELNIKDVDSYLCFRVAEEITVTLLHELTHIATEENNCDKWNSFLRSLFLFSFTFLG